MRVGGCVFIYINPSLSVDYVEQNAALCKLYVSRESQKPDPWRSLIRHSGQLYRCLIQLKANPGTSRRCVPDNTRRHFRFESACHTFASGTGQEWIEFSGPNLQSETCTNCVINCTVTKHSFLGKSSVPWLCNSVINSLFISKLELPRNSIWDICDAKIHHSKYSTFTLNHCSVFSLTLRCFTKIRFTG